MSDHDPYAVLGVPPNATDKEIRKAYISRCKVLHPDRFDPKTQPKEWAQANEMHAELNRAYATLRNASQRSGADAQTSAAKGQPESPNSTPGTHPAPHRSKRPFIARRVILALVVLGIGGLYLGMSSFWRKSGILAAAPVTSPTQARTEKEPIISPREKLRQNAERGDADAQFDLGRTYAWGEGVAVDFPQAVKWYRKAAEKGHVRAQFLLGLHYGAGDGVAEDAAEAVKWLRKAAETGDIQAQYEVGNMYAGGRGVAKNPVEAAKWYRMGAEQGHDLCQIFLARMYEAGDELPQDGAEAVKWYRKLAEKGEVYYAYKLGEKYRMGEGVPKDAVESVKWYRMGAEQGHDLCQTMLGNMYLDGVGVSKDVTEAARWYRKAAAEGDSLGRSIAQGRLGRLFARGEVIPKDSAEALSCCRQAAEGGDAIAQRNLADRYSRGDGVAKNAAEAAKWYRKAAESGDAIAQTIVGAMYASQTGAKDAVEGVKWYRKAAEQGNDDAQMLLGYQYEKGSGVPKDEIEALAWYYIAAASGNADARKLRTLAEARLGQQMSLLAQQRSKEILSNIQAAKAKNARITQSEQLGEADRETTPKHGQSGTGVFVTTDGLILTAAHVVKGVSFIEIQTSHGVNPGRLVKVDTKNDLALIKCDGKFQAAPVKAPRAVRLGQAVFTIGFPNVELQGVSPKMTRGEISSLAGLQDDPRQWQISVPVQTGNSGGPLFDEAGNVIGVIVAKLNAIKAAKFTGDLSQNVNYAVKSAPALQLLAPYSGKLARERQVNPSDKVETVVEQCRESVVLIFGYGP